MGGSVRGTHAEWRGVVMTRVAVTGSDGFIGRHVVRDLETRRGIDIVRVVRPGAARQERQHLRTVELDVHSADSGLFEVIGRPDVVIHLAWADVRGGSAHFQRSSHLESELPAQVRFTRALADSGLTRLVAAGTCQEYGLCHGPISESTPLKPRTPYSRAKAELLDRISSMCAETGMGLLWTRLFYLFGSGQPERSLYGGLMAAIHRGDPTYPMSHGAQLRDYLPVVTAARILCDLALSEGVTGAVNVGNGRPDSVRSLVESWIAEAGSAIEPDLGALPVADYESPAFWADTELLETHLAGASAMPKEAHIPYSRASTTSRDAEAAY
jgi:nucleoside-diphosphate-sugar epimerase